MSNPLIHKARKRFGQNFLHDQMVIQRIVSSVAPLPGQHLVEIGPGLGAITRPLLLAAGSLDVVELDRDLAPRIEADLGELGDIRVYQADALKFDFSSLAADGTPLRVVGNLPYNISTPLIFRLLDQADIIEDMHFMLQKEVVDRLAAAPDTADYGRLSVMVQYRCAVTPLFGIGPGAFNPPPKVHSAFVRLRPYATPPFDVGDTQGFARLVSSAFAHRRKTLRNNLKGLLDAEAIVQAGIDPGARAETLSLEQFATLSRAYDVALQAEQQAAPAAAD